MKAGRSLLLLIGAVVGVVFGLFAVPAAAQARTIYDSPYVTFAPDGKAWTTNAGDQNITSETGEVTTGIASSVTVLHTGEHYYRYSRSGTVPVGKWQVALRYVNCCHHDYTGADYHGIVYSMHLCLRRHFSGWKAYCADCGEPIAANLYYMSRSAAASLRYLEMGVGLDYYYLCPFCSNLEQGTGQAAHLCKSVSTNRYLVRYMPNTSETYGGFMQPSLHMYNNSTVYEGQEVTPQTHLSKNSYTRIGWEFAGWNTRADGTGVSYADEAEIRNLTAQNYNAGTEEGVVTLYAMWRRSESTLVLDPAGGTLSGSTSAKSLSGKYGETLNLNRLTPTPPSGCTVKFDTNGGSKVAAITGKMRFTEWTIQGDFEGKLDENVYTYSASDGHTDRLKAVYERKAITLPLATKSGYMFGGWYADSDCTTPVGEAGDTYVPTANVTLYAKWVGLRLYAVDNYSVLNGTGAVDLTWSQPDGTSKTYKVYQRQKGGSWKQVYSESETADSVSISKEFSKSGSTVKYTVPRTGFYTLTAGGAQGAGYGSYSGGEGGTVQGKFWLTQGEILSVTVGGQDGYNGGGSASQYGNGGGCTRIVSSLQGTLLIAGGGGGATETGNGYAGGSAQGLVSTGSGTGESGAAGGGGGAAGGRAGTVIRHYHTEGVCNHVHSGDSSHYGGCYTKAVTCGKSLQSVFVTKTFWRWAGHDTIYCPACGADATKGQICSGHHTYYYNHVCPVHGNREYNTSSNSPTVCSVVVSYQAACGRTTAYTCGYTNGAVISSKPAYGGSSYVNTTAAANYTASAGENSGDGYAKLESSDAGYLEKTTLTGLAARDKAAPDEISSDSVEKEAYGSDAVAVYWDEPEDNGTFYSHRVDSYKKGTSTKLLVSNITGNTLTSGVKGYYYWVDETKRSRRPDNARFLTDTRMVVKLKETVQYLHLCPVDKAGNVGDITHIKIDSLTTVTEIAWPLYTGPVSITEGENVCRADAKRTWYVRSDGSTEFELTFTGFMDGVATADYQPEELLFAAKTNGITGKLGVNVPKRVPGSASAAFSSSQLGFFGEGSSELKGGSYTKVTRNANRREAQIVRRFYTDQSASGQEIVVYPEVRAYLGEKQVVSDAATDLKNGITLILDGQAPEITGCAVLEDLALLDRRDGEVSLVICATDALSGVEECYLDVYNADNGSSQRYTAGSDGCIRVTITDDLPIFSGDLEFKVYASDRVGNETSQSYGMTEFDLQTEIVRILEPHEPQFKRGESGVLNITTWGYAEKVEVIFPEELTALIPDLNQTYVYDIPDDYKREEEIQFMIPLELPDDAVFTVTVRAYKGDKMMEQHPSFSVMGVTGTVLDEFRTRLR